MPTLSDLVNSFIEFENGAGNKDDDESVINGVEDGNVERVLESKAQLSLRSLLREDYSEDVKGKILMETEKVFRSMEGGSSSPELKRLVMIRLREAGFDAGLCKSQWEKTNRIPAGSYEFIDINVGKNRYILEFLLAGEFTIARPTNDYTNLIRHLPTIFIAEVDDLKKVVKVMCSAMRASMRYMDMHVPPWRKNRYMQAKWFGPYKRTTIIAMSTQNKVKNNDSSFLERKVGFRTVNT